MGTYCTACCIEPPKAPGRRDNKMSGLYQAFKTEQVPMSGLMYSALPRILAFLSG